MRAGEGEKRFSLSHYVPDIPRPESSLLTYQIPSKVTNKNDIDR